MILSDGVRSSPAVHIHVPGKREQRPSCFRRAERVLRETRNDFWPFGIRRIRGMNEHIRAVASPLDRLRIEEICRSDIGSGGQPELPVGPADDGPDLVARKTRPSGDGVSD